MGGTAPATPCGRNCHGGDHDGHRHSPNLQRRARRLSVRHAERKPASSSCECSVVFTVVCSAAPRHIQGRAANTPAPPPCCHRRFSTALPRQGELPFLFCLRGGAAPRPVGEGRPGARPRGRRTKQIFVWGGRVRKRRPETFFAESGEGGALSGVGVSWFSPTRSISTPAEAAAVWHTKFRCIEIWRSTTQPVPRPRCTRAKVSREVWHKAGEMGLLGVNCPEAYGGLGLDIRFAAVSAVPWQHSAAFVWRVGCASRAPPRRRPLQPSGNDSAEIPPSLERTSARAQAAAGLVCC